MDIPWPQTS